MSGATPGILLLSELYPPTIGGSGALLESLYSRLTDVQVNVLTGAGGSRVQRSLTVTAIPMAAPDWGLMRPASLARHVRVAREVRRLSPRDTIVHCGRGLPEGLSAMLSRRRFACWTHGEELGYASTSRELTWLLPRVYARALAVLANSHNSARLLHKWGVSPDRITVIHPGVDPQRFRPDADPGDWRQRFARNGELLLLSVGRLQRRKGHDLVLTALAGWQEADPPVRYLIAGDGDNRLALEQQVRDAALNDRVTFVGAIADAALPGLYAAADVFVMPNRSDGVDFEGFGIVFLEAAASGLPCIAGNSGGAPEAIEDGQTGYLVSGHDADELRQVLERLTGSVETRRRMGACGRERILRDFTEERGAAVLSAVHRRVAGDAGA
jgi:phosphatidylinositol alpha-1,6-mannosyltransferase